MLHASAQFLPVALLNFAQNDGARLSLRDFAISVVQVFEAISDLIAPTVSAPAWFEFALALDAVVERSPEVRRIDSV